MNNVERTKIYKTILKASEEIAKYSKSLNITFDYEEWMPTINEVILTDDGNCKLITKEHEKIVVVGNTTVLRISNG